MTKLYTVEQFEITRKGRYDDESERNVVKFDNLNDAEVAFAAADMREAWMFEKACSNVPILRQMVMACELREIVLDEDGEIVTEERLDYKEYGGETV